MILDLKFQKNILKFLVFSYFCFFSSISVSSQDVNQLKDERDKIEKELIFTSKLLETTRSETSSISSNLLILSSRLSAQQKLVDSYLFQKKLIEKNIYKTDSSIHVLNLDIQRYKNEYGELIIELYKRRDKYELLAYILSSNSFNQAYQRYKFIQTINANRKNQLIALNRMNELLLLEQQKLETLKSNLQESLDLLGIQTNKLEKEKKDKEAYINSLKGKERVLLDEIKKKKESQDILEKRIADIISSINTKKNYADVKDFEKAKGLLLWPLQESLVISTFGEHDHPVIKGLKVKNNGIDIKVINNDLVSSIFEGEVSRVISIPGYNKAVIIRHGVYLTVYANLESVDVKLGQLLKVGTPIGQVYSGEGDNSGILHFELWKENSKLDPLLWLKH